MRRTALALALAAALAACGEFTPTLNSKDQPDLPSGPVQTTASGSWKKSIIDATSQTDFTGIDLETGAAATYGGPDWDLAFGRARIRSNGGVDGTGGVAVAGRLFTAGTLEAEWAALAKAWDPAGDTYWTDAADGPDSNSEPDTIFENAVGGKDLWWYDYDSTWHELTPRAVIYVVRSTAGKYYKVNLLGYYSETGVSAVYSLRWAQVAAP